MNIMKFAEFHTIITKKRKKCNNNENHQNLNIPRQNNENQGIPRIPCQNNENHENLIIPR